MYRLTIENLETGKTEVDCATSAVVFAADKGKSVASGPWINASIITVAQLVVALNRQIAILEKKGPVLHQAVALAEAMIEEEVEEDV